MQKRTDETSHLVRGRPAGRWWLVLLVVLSLVAAACGGDDDDSGGDAGGGADTEDSGGDVDPAGIAKFAVSLEAAGRPIHFDPATSPLNADLTWMHLIFGTLLRENEKGEAEPWMAEAVDVVDPQTVKLTLRKGLTFTDGAAYDSEAVKSGLLRTKNQAVPDSKSTQHAGFKFLEDVVVDSPTQVTIKLNAPAAGEFLFSMAHREGSIVSPKQASESIGAIDAKPVGAGPYLFETFKPNQILSVRKNPDFFDAKSWKLGGIDWIHSPDGPAGVNGLISGTVDYAGIPDADITKIAADSRFGTHAGSTDFQYVIMQMCPTKPPFDKADFRKAVQKAIDRDSLSKLVYGGRAKPAYGLWPEGHGNFNPAVKKINGYDVAAAKKLVTSSGVADPSFDLYLIAGIGYDRIAEVLQSQLEAVGIKVNITQSSNIVADFVTPQKAGAFLLPGSRQRVDKYGRLFAAGGVTTLCGAARTDIMDIVTSTAALQPDDPKVAEAYQKAELMVAENANPIPLVYPPQHSAWNKSRLGGTFKYSGGLGSLKLDSIYIKK